MIETATVINSMKEAATKLKLKEAAEVLEIKEGELIKDSPIINTLDEINNSSLENLKLKNEVKEHEIERIKTINSHLEGTTHPESGVPYVSDIVELPDGRIIEGVFPEFESIVDIQLPEELLQESDTKQMRYCNEQLKKMLEENPELREKFTERQLEQIEAGYKPEGYTWHHHQETGKMQLVEYSKHDVSRHTGGKSLWGGGSSNR